MCTATHGICVQLRHTLGGGRWGVNTTALGSRGLTLQGWGDVVDH